MNTVTQVTQVTAVPVAPSAPSASDQLLAAETAAWDAYEAALAVVQEAQDALVSAGSSVLKAYRAMQWQRYRACNALEAALAVARAEYDSANHVTPVTQALPVHEVTGLLCAVHGLTVRYYKRDTRVIAIVADDAARLFADSDPATQVACYPNGRTVYSLQIEGWTVRFDQLDSPLPPAPPLPVIDIGMVNGGNGELAAMSLSELEAAMYAAPYGDEFNEYVAEWQGRLELEAALKAEGDDAHVVTGEDGLDHYL